MYTVICKLQFVSLFYITAFNKYLNTKTRHCFMESHTFSGHYNVLPLQDCIVPHGRCVVRYLETLYKNLIQVYSRKLYLMDWCVGLLVSW